MPTSIQLTTSKTLVENTGGSNGNLAGYRLSMTAVGTGIDSNVFIFQRGPAEDGASEYSDVFYTIASVDDMENLAVDEPNEGQNYYRSDSIELTFGSPDEVDYYCDEIKSLLRQLARANDLAQVIDTETEILTA